MSKELEGVTKANAVWDFTSGAEGVFFQRLTDIKDMVDSLASNDIAPDFKLLIHARATKFVTKTLDGTVFEGETLDKVPETHALLNELANTDGVDVLVCEVGMARHGVALDNIQPFTTNADNVAVTSIVLQNKGYALMHVDLTVAP
jgi:intracellular sulfur oxidation DsrE/DsrF family protein